MFINEKEAVMLGEELKKNNIIEKLKNIKDTETKSQQQCLLVRKLFSVKFNEWYVKYQAKLAKVPHKFNFINYDYQIFDGCVNPDIDYSARLMPEYKNVIKNEIYTVIDKELKEKGFRVYKVVFKEAYFSGSYLDMSVSICDINAPKCSVM
jgi:hypothetical protein